jgi:hypothetical protein
MAIYSANGPAKTLIVHKEDCHWIPRDKLRSCGCGSTSDKGNQEWWCEDHITRNLVNEFQHNRFWAIILCDTCFSEK